MVIINSLGIEMIVMFMIRCVKINGMMFINSSQVWDLKFSECLTRVLSRLV